MSPDEAREDLAFLRALVQAGDDGRRQMGEAYLAGGVCYGVQMLGHGGQFLGWVPDSGPIGLAIAAGPTVVFLVLITLVNIRRRRATPRQDAASRAVGSVFAAVGLANFALIAIIGNAAIRAHSLEVWQIYPSIILVMQGAAWMVSWLVKRQTFAALMSVGWFISGVAAGLSIGHLGAFILVLTLSLWLLMALPGYLMMRDARPA